ncbi:MAG: hypothetical protein RR382_02610 [Tannerellaceae bacterium]
MKKIILVCTLSFLVGAYTNVVAQASWLPEIKNTKKNIRLLECTYNEAKLKQSKEINVDSNWAVSQEQTTTDSGKTYTFHFTAKQDMKEAGIAVAFDRYGWTSDNYVMIPSSVYNGNRQRIVNREYASGLDKTDYNRRELALTSNPIPQLSPEFGRKSRLEVNISNTATPAMAILERAKQNGILLLTDQGINWDNQVLDHALIVEESLDRSIASFIISAPGVRERKPEFIGFSKSPDRGIQVKKGDEIVIRVTEVTFFCQDVPELLSHFMKYRKVHTNGEVPRNLMPMSEVFARMVRNIDDRYYKGEQWEYYCPENANWMSYGWIGGLMNTYPMLALGDSEHRQKVKNTFDFALSRAKGESGYYYDVLAADGKPMKRDAAAQNPGIGLTRRNSDILYWMVKQFMLLKQQGKTNEIDPAWEADVCKLADAFMNTWKKEGTWGNYVYVESGDVAVYNTTSGAMTVAGLVLSSIYYNNPEYLETACQAALDYYADFALLGFTSGGCGDILQNADSETAVALMTSLMTLYEATDQEQYLKQAGDLANLCATWTVSFPYRMPENTPLAKLGANLTGAVWASTQNKHGAPGFCTQSGDALFKLYRATGETLYAELLRDVIHAHAEGVQPNGKITERLTYCDADSRGSRGDGGQTGWNELNGALMSLEIPGIYVRIGAKPLFYVFDHLEAHIVSQTNKQLLLEITNPTAYNAEVTIFAENEADATRPLGDNAFLRWNRKVKVNAGKTIHYKLTDI